MPSQEKSLIPPQQLPDLAISAPHVARMALRRVFQQGGATEHRAYILQFNAVRLADTALTEYMLAKSAIDAYHRARKGWGIGQLTRASGHFECCIWALERFIKHAKAIRSSRFIAAELSSLIPKKSKFLSHQIERRITKMRHALAHLEGEALNGSLPQGSNILLLAVTQGLCVGKHEVTWEEFTNLLTEVHACASSLADYIPVSPRLE